MHTDSDTYIHTDSDTYIHTDSDTYILSLIYFVRVDFSELYHIEGYVYTIIDLLCESGLLRAISHQRQSMSNPFRAKHLNDIMLNEDLV